MKEKNARGRDEEKIGNRFLAELSPRPARRLSGRLFGGIQNTVAQGGAGRVLGSDLRLPAVSGGFSLFPLCLVPHDVQVASVCHANMMNVMDFLITNNYLLNKVKTEYILYCPLLV